MRQSEIVVLSKNEIKLMIFTRFLYQMPSEGNIFSVVNSKVEILITLHIINLLRGGNQMNINTN